MHEYSIALRVIEIAGEEARKARAEKVTEVELDVGDLSGVMIESLEFAFETAREGAGMPQTRLKIHRIEALARCTHCGHQYSVKQFFETCPACGEMQPEIIQGRELKMRSVTVE